MNPLLFILMWLQLNSAECLEATVGVLENVPNIKRKCCANGEFFNYDRKVCVFNDKLAVTANFKAQENGFLKCGDSTVQIELESERNKLSITGNGTSLSALIGSTTITTGSYCADTIESSGKWMALTCSEDNVCEVIPCIRLCCGNQFYSTTIPPLRLPVKIGIEGAINRDSTYGIINRHNCSKCVGKELELDPVAYAEHEYFFWPNGSLYLTYQKEQLDDRYCVRYSKKSKQVQIFVCFHDLRDAHKIEYDAIKPISSPTAHFTYFTLCIYFRYGQYVLVMFALRMITSAIVLFVYLVLPELSGDLQGKIIIGFFSNSLTALAFRVISRFIIGECNHFGGYQRQNYV